jgi:SAM-dependent methyltransferase
MMKCRSCDHPLNHLIVDLEEQPSANRLLSRTDLVRLQNGATEWKRRLAVYLCENCTLVQLGETEAPERLFTENYVYYSSYSAEWVERAKKFVELVVARFSLTTNSRILEVGSNDGYLLQHFVSLGIPCLGVDPAGMAAKAAKEKDVDTVVGFFNEKTVQKIVADFGTFDLLIGNNVFAHIPNIRDSVAAMKYCLAPGGILSLEFPHLANLIQYNLFDTIYDEHYFYYSVIAVQQLFAEFGLRIFEIQELSTHGGSLRIFASHQSNTNVSVDASVESVVTRERQMILDRIEGYKNFQKNAEQIRQNAVSFIEKEKEAGKKIAAFGAAAKGNIFLNYCGIGASKIDFVSDDTPAKQGKFLPGSHIPIVSTDAIRESKPDIIIILPWNSRNEICRKLSFVEEWGAKLVTFFPGMRVR